MLCARIRRSLVAMCMAAYSAICLQHLTGSSIRRAPYCSRLAGVAPALIISVDGDPLRDEAENYGAALIASGVTTQVSRLARVTGEMQRWSDAAWGAIVDFLGPRLRHAARP